MEFLNREAELGRLDGLLAAGGGLGVVYGRRRVGKTRLLVEWLRSKRGAYAVADQSTPDIQRRYLAEAVQAALPGFAEVTYPDWGVLLSRLAREARGEGWRGPLVLDELPYLVESSPELPAILQRWVDHEAKDLTVVMAGSSQHMMQGLVLDSDAPLFGRARELLELRPLSPRLIGPAFGASKPTRWVEHYAAWGGVPRYWELAAPLEGSVRERVDRLVLDPLGPLHREPDRLIAEELPPATEVRPVLDAIGAGAHRLSAIASRMGRPATSMTRPLARLQNLGLAEREVPFGESERSSKRSLYKIADPFTRLWFRAVAPHRGPLATATAQGRLQIFDRHWPSLLSASWEDLCRLSLPSLNPDTALGRLGPWGPGQRWWRASEPEWDVIAPSLDGQRVLLGEAKLSAKLNGAVAHTFATRPPPPLPRALKDAEVVRVLFVMEPAGRMSRDDLILVTPKDLLG